MVFACVWFSIRDDSKEHSSDDILIESHLEKSSVVKIVVKEKR
jgi:hypothetical protein